MGRAGGVSTGDQAGDGLIIRAGNEVVDRIAVGIGLGRCCGRHVGAAQTDKLRGSHCRNPQRHDLHATCHRRPVGRVEDLGNLGTGVARCTRADQASVIGAGRVDFAGHVAADQVDVIQHRCIERLGDVDLLERGVGKRIRRVVLAFRITQGDGDKQALTRAHYQFLTHGRAAVDADFGVGGHRVSHGLLDEGLVGSQRQRRVGGAHHEGQAVDQLTVGHEAVAAAQTVDDLLGRQVVRAFAHQHMVTRVFAGVEVCRRLELVRAERATVVIVGTGKEPPVATFAEQRIPDTANGCGIDAGAAVGAAADCAGAVAAALRFGTVAGHRLETEGDVRGGIVEVAQVLDVVARAAGRVVDTRPLKVSRDEIAGGRGELGHPLHALDGLDVAQTGCCGAVVAGDLFRGGVDVSVVAAAGDRAVPLIGGAAAGVAVGPVEAVFVLGLQVGIAGAARGRPGQLAGEHVGGCVLVTRGVLLQTQPDRLLGSATGGFGGEILERLDFLPAPHRFRCGGAVAKDGGASTREGGFPGLVRAFQGRGWLAARRVSGRRPGAGRAGGQAEGGRDRRERVFCQRAVASRAAAVVGLHEPVEAPGVD